MNTFKSVFDYLFSLSSEERGKVFERFCKWFLENEPRYSMQFKKVWLWKDWPGNWGRDKGIDLIAETHNGEIWAIQAKAYDQNYYITKDDVDRFLSESSRKIISYRLLISTTNLIGSNALEVINAQEKQVGTFLLDDLKSSLIDCSQAFSKPDLPAAKKINLPFAHQEAALKNIQDGFSRSPAGQVYMACGTGKTLVGLWTAERLKSHCTLVLVPSISLISQMYRQWAANSAYNFEPIFVCSDETVARKESDEIVAETRELGFPVTTSADELIKRINQNNYPKVVFSTYHSSPVIKQACALDSSINFDLAIADEAHRCAGQAKSDFATIVNKEAIRVKYKLFMTATPKIFSNHVKQKTQEAAYEIVSMDDEDKFGSVFYKLLFSEAIRENLLSDYQVLISVMDNETYRGYAERGRFVVFDDNETDARTLASQLLIAKAIKNFGLKKIISFHNKKKSAQEFISTFSKSLSLLADNEKPAVTYQETIFGEMPQSERKKLLNRFENLSEEEIGLLGNVRCLSEGVDLPALDGVVFVDPKGSEIDIVQAVGRAIRKSPDKKIGTIIIPLFVDARADETVDLEQSCFKVIWKVIKALRAHDDQLAEELDSIRLELGKKTYKKPQKLSKITIDIPIEIKADFAKKLEIKVVENCSKISLAQSHPELAKQWHPTKNANLTPGDVSAGSNKRVWWKCEKAEDHIWIASIKQRARGDNCPACCGLMVVQSNCLATTHPEIANQWHPAKNGNLTPQDVVAGSNKKVWWICDKAEDHEWHASICKRTNERNCPMCSNKAVVQSNCLATTHPELAKEWHPTKNGSLTSRDVVTGSHKKVWWRCDKADDHEWQASIKKRTIGQNCPICLSKIVVSSNCLATTHPELVKEWHPSKNGNLTPRDVVAGSHKKIWWICEKEPDHVWMAVLKSRTYGRSCPICTNRKVVLSNSLATLRPEIAAEWDIIQNGALTPYDVTIGSHKKVWWKCSKKREHEWKAVVYDRTKIKSTGCPLCYKEKY